MRGRPGGRVGAHAKHGETNGVAHFVENRDLALELRVEDGVDVGDDGDGDGAAAVYDDDICYDDDDDDVW